MLGGIFMNEIEAYVMKITSDLPISDIEKEELKLEMVTHIEEHVNELLACGWTEGEAVRYAIQAFGNESKINYEMKKAVFPYYKIVRVLWSVAIMTSSMLFLSNTVTEYYYPKAHNSFSAGYVFGVLMLFLIFAAPMEALYEAVTAKAKRKWLVSPWLFLIPAFMIAIPQYNKWSVNPEQYPDWMLVDSFSVPIGVFLYLISREIFNFVFVPKSYKKIQRTR
jgi:hypothetical protein